METQTKGLGSRIMHATIATIGAIIGTLIDGVRRRLSDAPVLFSLGILVIITLLCGLNFEALRTWFVWAFSAVFTLCFLAWLAKPGT